MDKPNVLVMMCDQMKATASHLYGNTFCETPSMERLANEGVLFQHAITPHPLCGPARTSLWTSQFPHSHGGRRNQTLMPPDAVHAFKQWKSEGFHCGLIGKNHCFETEDDLALFETWCEMGHAGVTESMFEELKGLDWVQPHDAIREAHKTRKNLPHKTPRFAYGATDAPLECYSSGLLAAQTERFLEVHQDEPFALWLSFPDPHEPWEAPREYYDQFTPDKIDMPPWRDGEFTDGTTPERNRVLYEMMGMEEDTEEDIQGVMAAYYGATRFLDDSIGKVLDALERLDLRKNTIVVFCSDHGDMMGEHRMQCKGGVFYDCLTRVPLIVSWPGQISEGIVDESMVNLIDVVPTLRELQGLDVSRSMHGQGLPSVTDAAPRDAAFSEYGAGGPTYHLSDLEALEKPYGRRALMSSLHAREAEGRRKMVRTKDWKYVHDPMGDKDELYDLVNDPWELYNVVEDLAHSEILADLRLKLADWSIQTEDAKAVPLP
ncbi:MAG: sulfatase-like hydrolase/transferase [Candidatus Latescibacteria bacterium]|nr:sulfatase-like hydrolase/transferase [Candidatus Latescibacterota bacterium]